ncbi:MAG: cytochrome c3 family protein [Thermoanaerobaculia bacterium]
MARPRFMASLAALFVTTVLFAHHGPAKITIDAAKAKQPAVTFDHAKHATTLVKSCDTCHHTQKGLKTDEGTKVVKCTTCHLNAKGNVPNMREASLTKNPFHMACIDCHKKEKKGPVACTGCHAKK